jgi:GntR family transcriptional regulator, arabinose operon transcriptional repressor
MQMSERIPKYEMVKRHIRHQIQARSLTEGDRVPSEHELVGQLGVGRGQARQALRELELEGYIIRRQGSGSYVAPGAGRNQGQMASTPHVVAAAFPTYSTTYIRGVLESFMETLFEADYGVTNYNLLLTEDQEVQLLDSVPASGVAGLLVWLGNETDAVRMALQRLCDLRFPVVAVDRYFPDVDTDVVTSDNEAIGYTLTRALIARGHTRIGVGVSNLDLATSQNSREAGYRRALQEAEISWDLGHRLVVDPSNPDLPSVVNAVMAPKDHPTAFMCINDIISAYLGRELGRLGYNVPEDVALSVVDDGGSEIEGTQRVLCVQQNAREIGRRSAELILARLSDPDRPHELVEVEPGDIEEQELAPPEFAGARKEGER